MTSMAEMLLQRQSLRNRWRACAECREGKKKTANQSERLLIKTGRLDQQRYYNRWLNPMALFSGSDACGETFQGAKEEP